MAEPFEEKYEDVLQNIEFALVQVYRAHPEMSDFEARDAMQALIRTYQAETRGQAPPTPKLKPCSLENWNKRGGRRGYFDFVQQFLP